MMSGATNNYINNSDPSDILDGRLFLGNARCADDFGATFDMVVNCTKNLVAAAPVDGQLYTRIAIDDDPLYVPELFRVLSQTAVLDDIERTISGGGRCLVHCMAGAQRSAAVVACFLVARRGLDPDAAVRYVRSRRPAAFFCGLVNFEKTIAMIANLPNRIGETRCLEAIDASIYQTMPT